MSITDFKVVPVRQADIEAAVSEAIADGWQPYWGPYQRNADSVRMVAFVKGFGGGGGGGSSGGDASASNQVAIKASVDSGFTGVRASIGNPSDAAWAGSGNAAMIGLLKALYAHTVNLESHLDNLVAPGTPQMLTVTGSGSLPAGAYSAGFYNAGAGDMQVAGGLLGPGDQVTFTARPGGVLGAIPYNTDGGGSLRIAEVR